MRIEIWMAVVCIIFSAGVAWGVTVASLKKYLRDLDVLMAKIDKMKEAQTRALYQPDGVTNYMPRRECEKKAIDFCDKIAEIKSLMESMDSKREGTRAELSGIITTLAESCNRLAGKIETMENLAN